QEVGKEVRKEEYIKGKRKSDPQEDGHRPEMAHERKDTWVEGRDSGKEGQMERRRANGKETTWKKVQKREGHGTKGQ
ncbi:hypothetical protein ACQP3J_31400, partial [Escherichia coli]